VLPERQIFREDPIYNFAEVCMLLRIPEPSIRILDWVELGGTGGQLGGAGVGAGCGSSIPDN